MSSSFHEDDSVLGEVKEDVTAIAFVTGGRPGKKQRAAHPLPRRPSEH